MGFHSYLYPFSSISIGVLFFMFIIRCDGIRCDGIRCDAMRGGTEFAHRMIENGIAAVCGTTHYWLRGFHPSVFGASNRLNPRKPGFAAWMLSTPLIIP